MVPRPDERAAQSYKERDVNFRSNVKKGIQTAAKIGLSAASPAIGARIAPFLSEYIPIDLAMKGIDKISPKIGKFLRKGQSMGLDLKEGLDYVKEKIEPAKEKRNIIQQYAPDLHQFIDEQIKNGRSPLEAAGIAKVQPKFSDAIKKLVKDHKTPWASIIESIYGTGERALPEKSENRMQTQPQNQPRQGGQGQQALTAILAQINQKLGPK